MPKDLVPLFDIQAFHKMNPNIRSEKALFGRLYDQLKAVDMGDDKLLAAYRILILRARNIAPD